MTMTNLKFKNFKSIDGTEKYIINTLGWSFRINHEWFPVPEYAWQDCYAEGCISEDQVKNTIASEVEKSVVDTLTKVRDREDSLKAIVRDWYENNEKDKFDKQGQPKTLALKEAAGLQISVQERNKIWRELQEELK